MRSYHLVSLTLAGLLLFSLPVEGKGKKVKGWEEIDGCKLLDNDWNDGDSFHIEAEGKERIFRLYFVDCPEVEATFPKRVEEQAEYFGITSNRALQIGKQAQRFSAGKLRGARFSVWTRWEDAEGASKLKRYFAIIKVDGKDMGEMLVEEGLARVYGKSTVLPDGLTGSKYFDELDAAEAKAKRANRGAWAK